MGYNCPYHEEEFFMNRQSQRTNRATTKRITKRAKIKRVVQTLVSPLQKFMELEASSGVCLIVATVCALALANSSFAMQYFEFIRTPFQMLVGNWVSIDKTLLLFVNDGLMAIFFFLVGLEIKQEVLIGELSSFRKASFSVFAAVGGLVVPALIYISMNHGTDSAAGWGIPMATDIAFAIGILTLIGKGVPVTLKIFLLALAIVDDLGAISVIALFYTDSIKAEYLLFAGLTLSAIFLLINAGIRNIGVGIILGTITWYCFLKSGVHATIAGVLLAFLTPSYSANDKPVKNKSVKDRFVLDHLIHGLHPWVAFFIMPVFAFFNAGVSFDGVDMGALITSPITLGISLGLVLGKCLGIVGFAYAACKVGLSEQPAGTTWGQVLGVSFIAGVGFTMSLFIGSLAFSDESMITASKIGIFLGSGIAMILGAAVLLITKKTNKKKKKT